ncbi:ParB/RepB/Spo0J family partition protein [Kitasatospora sp. NPDC058046]|uniref:ParB/RepB/Spo0J family partition protein n=1 Tax=Kitasatospora sp. NPDC058046 TaxID=3346312 RepID=UPI0036D80791
MESTWKARALCWCGTSVPDEDDARQGHQNAWHTDAKPAVYAIAGPGAAAPSEPEQQEQPVQAEPDLTITHTRAQGTLLEGSRKGDGVWEIVRPIGFRSSRTVGLYLPRSRDRRADTWRIGRAKDALEAAGFTVAVEIDEYERRSFAEAEADRTERAEERAERFDDRAGRALAASDARHEAARSIMRHIPFGQPILVGHHSQRRAEKDAERIDGHMRKSIAEGKRAQHWAARAEAAGHYEEHRKNPGTTLRRIEKLEAEKRTYERRQAQAVARASKAVDGELDPEVLVDALAANDLELLDLCDELGYWRAIVAKAEAEGFKVWGPADFVPGDYALYCGDWHQVARVNAKSLSIAWNLRASGRVVTLEAAQQMGRHGTHVADYTKVKARCPETAMRAFLDAGKIPGTKSAAAASADSPASALREAEAAKPKAPKKRADPKIPKRVKVECRWDATEALVTWLDGRGKPHPGHPPVKVEALAGTKYAGSVHSDELRVQVAELVAGLGLRYRGSWSGGPGAGIVCAVEPVPAAEPEQPAAEPDAAPAPAAEPEPEPEKAADLRICGSFFAQIGLDKLTSGNDGGVTTHHPTRKAGAMPNATAPRFADWFKALLDQNRPLAMTPEEFEQRAHRGYISYELGGTDGHYAPEPLDAWVAGFRADPVGALYWGNDQRTELAPYANAYAAAVGAAQPAPAARPGEGRDDLIPLHCSRCDESGPLRVRERGDFGCDNCGKPVNMSALVLPPGGDWAVRADGLLCRVPAGEPVPAEPVAEASPEPAEEPAVEPAPELEVASDLRICGNFVAQIGLDKFTSGNDDGVTNHHPTRKARAMTATPAAKATAKPRAAKKAAAPAEPAAKKATAIKPRTAKKNAAKAKVIEPTKVQTSSEVKTATSVATKAPALDVREMHKLIPIEQIEVDETQPREEFDPVKLQELADSMKEIGQLQSITIRRVGLRRYKIVVGERRWRAAKIAGLTEMKTIVRTGGEAEAGRTLAEQVAENAARADMTPMEEAKGFKRLVDEYGYELAQVAKMVGKSPQYVGWRIDLLKLSAAAQDALSKGHLPVGLSWYVAQLSTYNQARFLAKWTRDEFKTVRDAEAFAQAARTEEARQEQQGSFFVLADADPRPAKDKQEELLPGAHLPESERERIQNDRKKLVGKVDSLSSGGQILADLAAAAPEELALLLAGTPGGVAGYSLRLKHLADVISKAQANLRKAEAIAAVREGSTIQINPELAAA